MEVPQEMLQEWTLIHVGDGCTECGHFSQWVCWKCDEYVCEDGPCIENHILNAHPIEISKFYLRTGRKP